MKKAAIVACSNAQQSKYRPQIGELITFLQSIGIETELSECIYSDDSVFSGTPGDRGAQLMKMFRTPEIEEIYDISGGDVANQILDELDYKVIAASKAIFWGYSDLSTVINAIYTMTGKESVLYQVKNMVRGDYTALQRERFRSRKGLFEPSFSFIQKNAMKGVVVGGNIRCFLKLAGTRYFPDLQDKILFNGVLLGTFTTMEQKRCEPDIVTLVKEICGREMPIAKTAEVGHGDDSKAIVIGREIELAG